MKKHIILASASPRRKELLEQIGLPFEVRTSGANEITKAINPEDIGKELSQIKAQAVWDTLTEKEKADAVVIGADTIVCVSKEPEGKESFTKYEDEHGNEQKYECKNGYGQKIEDESERENGKKSRNEQLMTRRDEGTFLILGKPKDEADAAHMLRLLSGRVHQVFTGVTILSKEKTTHFYECTDVHVAKLTETEISEYIATKDPMDKAGAYGIQGMFARYITGIEGDYNTVVGLPVCTLYHELQKFGEQ